MTGSDREKIAEILRRESAYAAEAYEFVGDAVAYTVAKLESHRHVSAAELLRGVRDFAAKEFGVVANAVLDEWGLHSASDVGKVVYLMIEAELLSASPEDSPHDFDIDFAPAPPPEPPAPPPHLPKIDG